MFILNCSNSAIVERVILPNKSYWRLFHEIQKKIDHQITITASDKSENTLRRDAQQGICPYIVASKRKGSKSYIYYINITALREFEGIDVLNSFYDDQLAAENQDN